MAKGYNWEYISLGGVVRVRINSGEDIAHLGELDQKKWTVLSCPVDGLEFDRKTLQLVDADSDGKIRVAEIVAAAEWLTSVVRDKDILLKGDSVLPLDQINTDCEEGCKLYESAKHILKSLGKKADSISIDDTSDGVAIFSGTRFNGDGIITEATADDAHLKEVITLAGEKIASMQDRNGETGIDAATIEKFYAECADFTSWKAEADSARDTIFPYGDNTPAAFDAVTAIKEKIADYFMRCKLISFDQDASAALDVSVSRIGEIADRNLSSCLDEISLYPLARPSKGDVLSYDGINPAWKDAFASLKSLVLDVDFPGADQITESQWKQVLGKLDAYCAWMASKKGAAVESLDPTFICGILADGSREALLALVEKDLSLKEQSESIDNVDKLLHLYKYFYKLLCNFVVFTDFYGRGGEPGAIFEAGKLYIDERCCNLCLRIQGAGNHAEAAALSGMFLIYCTCTSKKLGETREIVAVMTDGGIKNLRPGKNAIFYDLEGNDWDAVITKIVDNPISIKQAFWSPYRKLANFINEKIEKSAADKDAAATADLLAKADAAVAADGKKTPFDIGKFAGIFAAISMAFAGIGVALKSLISGIAALKFWQLLCIIAGIILVISGPACFLAWKKLRKRNLGPVLNANGWAINSLVLVNILFGSTLTTVAKYPFIKGNDPFEQKTPAWKKWLLGIVIAMVAAFGVLYYTDNLGFAGIHRQKKAAEATGQVTEVAAETPTETPSAEVPSATTEEPAAPDQNEVPSTM